MSRRRETNTSANGLIKRRSSMFDKIASKLCIKTKKVIIRGKGSKILNDVKPVENISKNPQSFLDRNHVQKEVLPSHKLQDHVFE